MSEDAEKCVEELQRIQNLLNQHRREISWLEWREASLKRQLENFKSEERTA